MHLVYRDSSIGPKHEEMHESVPFAKESFKQSKHLNKYLSNNYQSRKHVQTLKENKQGPHRNNTKDYEYFDTEGEHVVKTFLANNGEKIAVNFVANEIGTGEGKMINNLYQSIQCSGSPEKQRL